MNVMIFCSNHINGGTARIFFECVEGLKREIDEKDIIFPCIDEGNDVELYHRIDNIIEMPIYSAEIIFFNLIGGSVLERIPKKILRTYKYANVKKHNVDVICDYLKSNHIDVVIIHNGGYIGDDLCNQVLEASYKCKEVVRKRIFVLHSDIEKNLFNKIRFCGYDKKISLEATEIVTVSDFTRNRMMNSSYISSEIKVIYDGIDVRKALSYVEKQETVRLEKGRHNILMIGNFLKNKGQHKFIEAMDILYKKNRNYRFTIIGNIYDKDYHKLCMNQIKEYGLNGIVTIHYGINNASEYIDMFDVMVVPSMYDESFGLISVEAMASGVPVVAFACGGIPEVVEDGRDGFIVPIGDSNSMAKKIDWLINHKEECRKMAEQCVDDYRRKFSTDAMIEEYMALLQ